MKKAILFILLNFCLLVFSKPIHAWTPAKRLTWNLKGSFWTSIAVDSNDNIYAVWYQNSSSDTEIYFRKSTDNGNTWGPLQRLTWMAGYSRCPDITVDSSDNLHLVWYDDKSGDQEIYYKKSTDGGSTWTSPKRLTWMTGSSFNPRVRVDSQENIHVVWVDDYPGHNEIYYKQSTDGGTSWSGARRLTNFAAIALPPSLAIDTGNCLHLVWPHSLGTPSEIYYMRSTDGGMNWDASRRLTWNTSDDLNPRITSDAEGNLGLVWQENMSGNYEVFFNRSTDGGTSWTANKRITWNSGNSDSPTIVALSVSSLHVVWGDNSSGDMELCYKKSTDAGVSWSGLTRLTYNDGDSNFPAMAKTSLNALHVVWQDNTPGKNEIYYSKQIYLIPLTEK
jgi:hypothetical protein